MPRSVTMRSRTRTRCSRLLVCAAYCAAFSAIIFASSSIRFSRCASHGLTITPPMTATMPTQMPRIGIRKTVEGPMICSSICLEAQLLDLAIQAVRAVGDDAFEIREPILEAGNLAHQPLILG